MRLPSVDLGSRRTRGSGGSSRPGVTSSSSTRSLTSVLRHWDNASESTGALGGFASSESTHSLAKKFSRAFNSLSSRPEKKTFEISAPISSAISNPGIACSDFGAPLPINEGWNDYVRVEYGANRPSVDELEGEVRRVAPFAPSLPDIKSASPFGTPRLECASTPAGSTATYNSFYFAPRPVDFDPDATSCLKSPSQESPLRAHTRHQSLPCAAQITPRKHMSISPLRHSVRPITPGSLQQTPTRPRNSYKHRAFYERASRPVVVEGDLFFPPSPKRSPVSPSPLTSASTMLSTSPPEFKIRRKPVPKLHIDTEIVSSSSLGSVSDTASAGSVSAGSSSFSIIGSPSSYESCNESFSTVNSPADEVPPSIAVPISLCSSPSGMFQSEIDTLFDELLQQCRSKDDLTLASEHQRTKSLPGGSVQGSGSGTGLPPLGRTRMIQSTHRLSLVKSHNDAKHLDVVEEHDTDHKHGDENSPSEPTTPRPKHRRVSDLRPFFPSARSFEPIRAPTNPTTPRSPRISTAGRVMSAVLGIERSVAQVASPSPANVTPISKLGSLLDQKPRTDSEELTGVSKRMMEEAREARRRRAQT